MKRDQLKSLLLGAILLAGITLPAKAQIGEHPRTCTASA